MFPVIPLKLVEITYLRVEAAHLNVYVLYLYVQKDKVNQVKCKRVIRAQLAINHFTAFGPHPRCI